MMELTRIPDPRIAGICGKFQRPENKQQGLHLLAEMGADAQLEADQEKVDKLIASIDLIFKLPGITINYQG